MKASESALVQTDTALHTAKLPGKNEKQIMH